MLSMQSPRSSYWQRPRQGSTVYAEFVIELLLAEAETVLYMQRDLIASQVTRTDESAILNHALQISGQSSSAEVQRYFETVEINQRCSVGGQGMDRINYGCLN